MSSDTTATSATATPVQHQFRLGSGIVHRSSPLVRRAILAFGRSLGWIFFSLRVEGATNLPQGREAIIVISNHFGWFDAFILTLYLPFQPVFLVATESQRKWYVRFFMNLFDGIPIWRGQVDREAFRSALKVLDEGRPLGVFPEGGINPELAERTARGEQITAQTGPTSRIGGALARAKPGTALLATMSHKRVLPIALLGSDRIGSNLRHLRRTVVTMRIGPIFGPLVVESGLSGTQRRARIDEMSDDMMREIARLFPPERRGPYAGQV
jgi:1-acyl-sn-glycerol-3-phosphate acyltransferase